MEKRFTIELIGYVASALIAVSMMLSSILRLRLINLAGALAFTVYGILIGAIPVAILNGLIVVVNAHFLLQMMRAKEYFHLLSRPGSGYLSYFLVFYEKDIGSLHPGFEYRPHENQLTLLILRDCTPAGVFIADEEPGGVLRVVLDYAIPRFRDFKIGRFLFVEKADFFRERGIREIIVTPRTADFRAYLLEVGFKPTGDPDGSFSIQYGAQAR